MTVVLAPDFQDEFLAVKAALAELEQIRECREHPAGLLRHVHCLDTEIGDEFEFHLDDPEHGWYWQRDLLDWWLSNPKTVVLKARQLGVSWLAAGLALWHLLYRPGTRSLVVSFNQMEAQKVIRKVWVQFQSLPEHLRNGVVVVKPARDAEPSDTIEVRHRNGKLSTVLGLPSTPKAGRSETAALVILDEFAFHEYAADTYTAALPTAAKGGRILVISTANGVSNEETGEGNHFHRIWATADAVGVGNRFYGWQTHPDRDQAFYDREVMAIPDSVRRGREYPSSPREAFRLTQNVYFDEEALSWYEAEATSKPLYRFNWERVSARKSMRAKHDLGLIRVFGEPQEDHKYAIGADVATGRGQDYSAAYVIDLSNMSLCAEFHGKCDADVYAEQLHYLGRYYNSALIAVETGGGFGEPVIIFLRDGKEGRPAYPSQYRHRQFSRGDVPEHKPFGFPMNVKTRPLVLEGLQRAIREKAFPWVTDGLLGELGTFVRRPTHPSPRAQDGCNDDRVMAAAITTELFRQYGQHADDVRGKRRGKRPYRASYPWQKVAA